MEQVIRHSRKKRLLFCRICLVLFSVLLLAFSAEGILLPIILLYSPLEFIFADARRAVAAQYYQPMLDLQSAEAREIYQKVLRPLVSIIFVHLLLVIINEALLFLGMLCRARFLLRFAMVMMILLLSAETVCYIYYLVTWEQMGCANYFSKMKMFRITRLPEKYYAIPFMCLHLGALLSFVMKTVYEIRERADYETRPEEDNAEEETIPMGCPKGQL
ncbi:hypothetical protein CRM22_008301 [Opisthorchis felineus]|uniref:Uncharacterized protein n=1 Tax=Opisthorchis felineus TaxID=147828 RepID=A0A4S2LDW0_OPIFE|nr:hypothetical protein CRM22_008301 [Opisthorchis felineus]